MNKNIFFKVFIIVLILLLLFYIFTYSTFTNIPKTLKQTLETRKKTFISLMPGGLKSFVIGHAILNKCNNLNNVGLLGGSGGCWTIESAIDKTRLEYFKVIDNKASLKTTLGNLITSFKSDFRYAKRQYKVLDLQLGEMKKEEMMLLTSLNQISSTYTNWSWENLVNVIINSLYSSFDKIETKKINIDGKHIYYATTWIQNKINNFNSNNNVYTSTKDWVKLSNGTPLGVGTISVQDITVQGPKGGYYPLLFQRFNNYCNQIKKYDNIHWQKEYNIIKVCSASSAAAAFTSSLPNNNFSDNYIPITKEVLQINAKTLDLKNFLNSNLNVLEPNSEPKEKINGLLQVMDEKNFEFCGDAAFTDKFMVFNLINSQNFDYDIFEFICIERSKVTKYDLWQYFSTDPNAFEENNKYISRAGDASIRLLDNCQVNECLKSTKKSNNTWLQIFKITGQVNENLDFNKRKDVIIYYFSCCNYANFQSINIPITNEDVDNFTQVYDDLQNILNDLTPSDLNYNLTFIDSKLVTNK